MIIKRCPRCGEIVHSYMIAVLPPINVEECFSCGWRRERGQEVIEIKLEEEVEE